MANERSTTHRIARNTLMLNLRTIISAVVGLYTSRVVLQTLGVVDYGVFGVVGGIVTMFIFVNASLSNATTRFITFEQEASDRSGQNEMFCSAFQAHLLIALLIFFLAQTIGHYVILTQLDIPTERHEASLWVYQFSIASAFVGIVQTPYSSSIIAHERLDVYAWFELLNVSLKLIAVFVLRVVSSDHLIIYGLLSFGISVIIFFCHYLYCHQIFIETHLKFIWRSDVLRRLLNFTGWTLYADGSVSIRQQGINIFINRFFGIVFNASISIALMVQGVFWLFGHNVISAFQPQIVKQYALNNHSGMQRMIERAMHFTLLSALIVSVPAILCMQQLLAFWLVSVPEYAVVLCQILILDNLIGLINHIFSIGIQASGSVRTYSIINGTVKLASLPIIFISLKFFSSPCVPYLIGLTVVILLTIVNLGILKNVIPSINLKFIISSFCRPLFLGIVAFAAVVPFLFLIKEGWIQFFSISGVFFLLTILGSYFLILDQTSRMWLKHRLVCILK